MEIIYTEITEDLTGVLLARSQQFLAAGKKVYYIVPSSMSFEKEKTILERLNKGKDTAVFDLLLTRFKQLPYYFIRNQSEQEGKELSPVGLSMLFRRVLKGFKNEEIPLFFALQNKSSFLEMLIDLRAELEKSNLTTADLPETEKFRELSLILDKFEEELTANYQNYSEFTALTEWFTKSEPLKNTVFIIDGYSRFSAEEELFLSAIQDKVDALIIGTYANDKDFRAGKFSNSVYQDALEMMERFRQKYRATLTNVKAQTVNEVYNKLTELVKAENTYTLSEKEIHLEAADAEQIEFWTAENQKAEIEGVAKKIRQEVANGKRFKDFTVLVGNMSAYETGVKELFELYEIPYFYAQEESMSAHPLLAFIESLHAIKKKNFRLDDVLSLLKTKLYNPLGASQEILDRFADYLSTFRVQGRKKYSQAFDLEELEPFRLGTFGEDSALQDFIRQTGKKRGKKWLELFEDFLKAGKIIETVNEVYSQALAENKNELASKYEQVWKLMMSNLEEFEAIFADESLSEVEFLDLILSGFQNANYRQVPANIDLVNLKDYGLVEPESNKIVFAIGLNQSNFPRLQNNSSLITDEEREKINAETEDDRFIDSLVKQNFTKNLTISISLVNSATEKLILSSPQIFDNLQDEQSNFLIQLMEHADEALIKEIRNSNPEESLEHIASKRAMVSTLGQIERQLSEEGSVQNEVFWGSVFRLVSKENETFRQLLVDLDRDIQPSQISGEVVERLYGDKIHASVSSFERFYNCEYQYFLENTLGLEATESMSLDARIVGNFFHEVFEKLMGMPNLTAEHFDRELERILAESQEVYSPYFEVDASSRFTAVNLAEISRQTAPMLKRILEAEELSTLSTESSFGMGDSSLGNFELSNVALRGRIDRIDQFSENGLAAVDYKSSSHDFDLVDAYDGRSLQLLTYLDVLKKHYPEQKIWGALYLQLKNDKIKLSDLSTLSDVNRKLDEMMRYKGLSLDKESLPDFVKLKAGNVFKAENLDRLLSMNEAHYVKASERLAGGELTINPVKDKKDVKGCQYCQLKSICRFEATRHSLDYTREVGKKSAKAILMEMEGE